MIKSSISVKFANHRVPRRNFLRVAWGILLLLSIQLWGGDVVVGPTSPTSGTFDWILFSGLCFWNSWASFFFILVPLTFSFSFLLSFVFFLAWAYKYSPKPYNRHRNWQSEPQLIFLLVLLALSSFSRIFCGGDAVDERLACVCVLVPACTTP